MYVIEHLDYEVVRKNPKPFIGMSDATIYHLALFAKTGLVGFHMDDVSFGFGRVIKEGQNSWPKLDQEFFLRFLAQTNTPGIIKPLSDWEEWKKGKAEGHLIGGILQLQELLSGTQYFPPLEYFNGSILFWEEIGKNLYEIADSLYKLKYMGVLDRISGMLIGKIKYVKPLRQKVIEPPLKEMVLEILKDYKFPIMANLDFGHFTVNIPMPVGIKVEFDTTKMELHFLESPVV